MDYEELEEAIPKMTPKTKLYRILKKGLTALGHWRNHPRGDPSKGYAASHKKEEE